LKKDPMNEQIPSRKKITVSSVSSWIFGINFTIAGLGGLTSGEPVPAIVMLIMGTVLLPPVTKLVATKWKFRLSRTIKAVVIIVGFIIFSSTIDTSKQPSKQIGQNNQQSEKITINGKNSKYIIGLAPVDVYLNMEKQGFKTEKKLGTEFGNFWISKKNYAGIDYNVETYSSNIDNIESVQATAIIDLSQKEIIAAQHFFIILSSLPYDNANQQKANQWIKDNYNRNEATTIIGDAKFTIYVPSSALRMLKIEKAK